MTSQTPNLVVGLIALNGGELVGRTRLQKIVFLLNQSGLNSGVDFDYHNFGPFSSGIALAADIAVATGRLQSEERNGFHNTPYTVYRTNERTPDRLGNLSAKSIQKKLEILNEYSSIELEVAATFLYLRENGYGKQAAAETKRRKPTKASPERIEKAKKLFKELGL